jgi:hypothetical protein
MIERDECSMCGAPWPYDKRKRTHTPCGTGSRRVSRRHFSLPEIKALLTEAKDIAGSSVLGAIQTREEDTLSYVDRIVTAAYRPIEDRVDALADAVPSEEHADASS